MHTFGAEKVERLQGILGEDTFGELLEQKYLSIIPSPIGNLAILGSNGRRQLGLSPFYKSPPETAVSQVLRRRIKDQLEQQGWQFQKKAAQNLHLYEKKNNQLVYSAAKYKGYNARSIRRILTSMRAHLIHEKSILLIWVKHPHHLAPLKHNAHTLLHVQHLPKFEGEEFDW